VEYPLVVALQLRQKASYDGDDAEGQQRRGRAYRLADRIIGQLANEHPADRRRAISAFRRRSCAKRYRVDT
jgi:hypothetical protein